MIKAKYFRQKEFTIKQNLRGIAGSQRGDSGPWRARGL